MDSDGIIVDEGKKPLNVSNEEVLTWYKNMLTGNQLVYPVKAFTRASTNYDATH